MELLRRGRQGRPVPADDAHDARHHGLDERPHREHRVLARGHREPRHGGHAQPRLNEAQGRAQVLDLVEPARPDRQRRQRRFQDDPVAAEAAHRDEAMGRQVLPADPLQAGQRVVAAADQQERVPQQRLELEVGLLRAEQVDAELGLAALDGLEDVVGREIQDADADAREPRVEVLDDPRQEVVGRGRHRADRHLPRRPVRQLADAHHRGVELVEQPLGLEVEVAADAAQAELPRVALDQPHAERGLQLLDPAGQRRLREVQHVGGAVEAADLGHGHEAAQPVEVVHHARHASFVQFIAFYYRDAVRQAPPSSGSGIAGMTAAAATRVRNACNTLRAHAWWNLARTLLPR